MTTLSTLKRLRERVKKQREEKFDGYLTTDIQETIYYKGNCEGNNEVVNEILTILEEEIKALETK